MKAAILAAVVFAAASISSAEGHGFMVKPKARNVVSRENNQQYCPHCFNGGGTGNVASNTPGDKWPYPETDQSVTRAGLCGDAAGDDFHLAGGKFYNGGEIQATYNKGGIIDIELGITAHHNGHFEFFLCDKNDLSDPNGPITLECLRKNKLERAFPEPSPTGSPYDPNYPGRYFLEPKCSMPTVNHGFITAYQSKMQYRLPADVTCEHCVLQWYWVTANTCLAPGYRNVNWPTTHSECSGDGGSQGWWASQLGDCSAGAYPEEFWNCADIKIVDDGASTPAPTDSQPATSAPTISTTTTTPSPTADAPQTSSPTTTSGNSACASKWQQCGGENHNGPTCCTSGNTCVRQSKWYSQCQPGSSPETGSPTDAPATDAPATDAPTTFAPTNAPQTSSPTVGSGNSACASKWQQCGGQNHNGPTCCTSGNTCVRQSKWYSQCKPGSSPETGSPTEAPVTNAPATDPPTDAPATSSPTANAGNSACAAKWEQCHGRNHDGPTCCAQGLKCEVQSVWYGQCVPGESETTPTLITVPTTSPPTDPLPGAVDSTGFATEHGKLTLDGVHLVDEKGEKVQLMGMSSHGLQWFPSCYTKESITFLVKNWGINVFRAAMYIGENGYATDRSLAEKVDEIVEWCEELGVYVMIDWHVLTPGNPNAWLDGEGASTGLAIDYWTSTANKYKDKKHVIYETANEPNGVSWEVVKAYHDAVIPAIREIDPDTIIIAGTPTWSQDINLAAANPVAMPRNVMYAFHFYAGTHEFLLSRVEEYATQIPIFVSEWGTSDASGTGGFFPDVTQKFLDIFSGKTTGVKLSWAQWSYADKSESSAALNPGACASGNWNDTSESGTFVRDYIKANVVSANTPSSGRRLRGGR